MGSPFVDSPAGSPILIHALLVDLRVVGAHASAVGRPKKPGTYFCSRDGKLIGQTRPGEETTAAHHSRAVVKCDRHQQSPMIPTKSVLSDAIGEFILFYLRQGRYETLAEILHKCLDRVGTGVEIARNVNAQQQRYPYAGQNCPQTKK